MDQAQTLTFPLPARFEKALQIPSVAPPAGAEAHAATSAQRPASVATSGVAKVVDALHRVDKGPLGLAEVATMIALAVIAHRLMTAKKRISSIAGQEARSSSIPEDTDENRIAFEARFGKGRP